MIDAFTENRLTKGRLAGADPVRAVYAAAGRNGQAAGRSPLRPSALRWRPALPSCRGVVADGTRRVAAELEELLALRAAGPSLPPRREAAQHSSCGRGASQRRIAAGAEDPVLRRDTGHSMARVLAVAAEVFAGPGASARTPGRRRRPCDRERRGRRPAAIMSGLSTAGLAPAPNSPAPPPPTPPPATAAGVPLRPPRGPEAVAGLVPHSSPSDLGHRHHRDSTCLPPPNSKENKPY